MGLAAALLRWPPARFWQATPHEFSAAIRIHREFFSAETESEKRDD